MGGWRDCKPARIEKLGEATVSQTPGCLILHGFTSSLDTVRALAPMAERLGLPYRMPVLRGHGTRPEDLRGVGWQDWYADAEQAFLDLRRDASQVIICALSMGGLVGLHLAAEHAPETAGMVSIATALQFSDPLAALTPLVARVRPMWPSPTRKLYADPSLVTRNTNYRFFATDAFASVRRYQRLVRVMLPRVRAPLLVIHSCRDRIVPVSAANIIHTRAGSTTKEIQWFDRSGHEMLQDCQAEEIVAAIEGWIRATAMG